MTWQPIETAPKDGTIIMLFVPNGQLETGPVTIGSYYREEERDERGRFQKGVFYPAEWHGWLGQEADLRPAWCDPTHWMPLPPPPEQSVSEAA